MSDYKIVDVLEQRVCFSEVPKRAFTDRSLVLAVLNHNSEDPEAIIEEGGTPLHYNVRVIIEVKEIEATV